MKRKDKDKMEHAVCLASDAQEMQCACRCMCLAGTKSTHKDISNNPEAACMRLWEQNIDQCPRYLRVLSSFACRLLNAIFAVNETVHH